MNEVLYIRLNNAKQAPIWWLVWSNSEREIIASGELESAEQLSLLSDKAKNREVVAIVPSQDVTLKSLKVPGKSQRSIRQAAPFMLEEELAQDVEQLFFAYADANAGDKVHNCFVAVVKKDLMTQWLACLKSADIQCQVMVPEVLMLPKHHDAWAVTVIDDQLVVRQGQWCGTVLEQSFWPLAIAQWQAQEQEPVLNSYSNLPDIFNQITINQLPEDLPLALMAQQGKPAFNLLQGAYAVKSKHTHTIKIWAMAAGLAALALLLTIGQKGAQLYQAKSQTQAIEQEIIDTYMKAFPETKRVRISTIKSQLKRKLTNVSSASSDQSFLFMMAKLQTAYAQVPSLNITSIKFDEKRGEIRLTASASDFQIFDLFKSALEREQLDVDQGAQNSQGNMVTGSISIKGRS